MLDAVDVGALRLIPLLFQTGYLTIGQKTGVGQYLLKIPNGEVKEAFSSHILMALTGQDDMVIQALANDLRDAFYSADIAKLEAKFRHILLYIPEQIHVTLEHYYHSILHVALTMLGFEVKSESSESEGRMDMRVSLPSLNRVYVMEFKYEKFEPLSTEANQKPQKKLIKETPEAARERLLTSAVIDALAQIKAKRYAALYLEENRDVIKLGVGVVGRTDVRVARG
jgi:hypothetical protein